MIRTRLVLIALCSSLLVLASPAFAGTVSYELDGGIDMGYTENGVAYETDGGFYMATGEPDDGTNPTLRAIEFPGGMWAKTEAVASSGTDFQSVGARARWEINLFDWDTPAKENAYGEVTAMATSTNRYWYTGPGDNTLRFITIDFAWDGILSALSAGLTAANPDADFPFASFEVQASVASEGGWYIDGSHTGFSWSTTDGASLNSTEDPDDSVLGFGGTDQFHMGLFDSVQNQGNSFLVTLTVAVAVEGSSFNVNPNGILVMDSDFLTTLGVTSVSSNVLNAPPAASTIPLPAPGLMVAGLLACLGIARSIRRRATADR